MKRIHFFDIPNRKENLLTFALTNLFPLEIKRHFTAAKLNLFWFTQTLIYVLKKWKVKNSFHSELELKLVGKFKSSHNFSISMMPDKFLTSFSNFGYFFFKKWMLSNDQLEKMSQQMKILSSLLPLTYSGYYHVILQRFYTVLFFFTVAL